MVEKRVSERLVEATLDGMVKYHARRGIRGGCACDVCEIKRRGIYQMMYWSLSKAGLVQLAPVLRPYSDDLDWAREVAIKRAREIKRDEIRVALKKALLRII